MTKNAEAKQFSKLWRAIIEFDMIQENDRILIGLSGGKDSMFLTHSLAMIKQYAPFDFSLNAFTLDPMFTADFPTEQLADFCAKLNIRFFSEQVNLAQAIQDRRENDPCFTCSFFRRGAMNRFAVTNGMNKIALAHHHDDAVETFFMSLLYSGQLKTFLPNTYLSRTGLSVIRPLIYFRECEIKAAIKRLNYRPLKSPCPFDGHTQRQTVKELIMTLGKTTPECYAHLSSAMYQNSVIELWPPKISGTELKTKFRSFWRKQTKPTKQP